MDKNMDFFALGTGQPRLLVYLNGNVDVSEDPRRPLDGDLLNDVRARDVENSFVSEVNNWGTARCTCARQKQRGELNTDSGRQELIRLLATGRF
ncbi:hypothetical protein C0Q70_08962 [Pomacea canaliculata]|uniref:Uncharacterized protein n=1 Tax=Pomacea canaliculata TaxID=400727 RepID=A0A2T7P8H3_POMCA|nr:hypothetical protein C0Q70_08962 [Pomacea canaliculata]